MIRVEWQLTSPCDPDLEAEGGESLPQEAMELSISVEDKKGAEMIFYCSTMTGEDHRYVIRNPMSFSSEEERDSASCYHVPEFEYLDEKLLEPLDEYLAELGMGKDAFDFVDAMALDKEQWEYARWVKASKTVVE